MTKRTILREKIIQVVVEDDCHISIAKCENHDNFDEHGSDWDLPIDDIDEARALLGLLTKVIEIVDLANPPEMT